MQITINLRKYGYWIEKQSIEKNWKEIPEENLQMKVGKKKRESNKYEKYKPLRSCLILCINRLVSLK